MAVRTQRKPWRLQLKKGPRGPFFSNTLALERMREAHSIARAVVRTNAAQGPRTPMRIDAEIGATIAIRNLPIQLGTLAQIVLITRLHHIQIVPHHLTVIVGCPCGAPANRRGKTHRIRQLVVHQIRVVLNSAQ